MSATHSPNVDDSKQRSRGGPLRRLVPRTFQARLTLGFVGVVALTLFLVSVFVINRLDDYFTQQQRAELSSRAENVAEYVDGLVRGGLDPVVDEDNRLNPLIAGEVASQAQAIADFLAQADVEIVIGLDGGEGVGFVPADNGTFQVGLRGGGAEGQTQEPIRTEPVRRDAMQSGWPYVITVQLSNPYTFRQQVIANVTSLLAAVGIVALGLAIIVAAGMAHRFTTPLRRLTDTSRSLAEGDLTKRIELAEARSGSSEISELAVQFNAMADRLEESVEIIRRDRDRSRDFLADVSHELRTPIAALLTFNELLTDQAGDDPAARAEFLDASRVQLERLDWLAQNLLELSKLDSGLVLLDLRPDDLRAAVESAVEQARPTAERRGVALSLSLPTAPLRVRHDPQRIGQVLTNLIGNAIKFTPPGGSVIVEALPSRDGARIDVTDTGIGIDAGELPRIFERFYRGSRANEARGSGSGLGLAIVRSIVDMHRGSVTVDSRLGAGSRFSVMLPRDPRIDEAPPPADVARDADAASAKVVDSSPTGAPGLNHGPSG